MTRDGVGFGSSSSLWRDREVAGHIGLRGRTPEAVRYVGSANCCATEDIKGEGRDWRRWLSSGLSVMNMQRRMAEDHAVHAINISTCAVAAALTPAPTVTVAVAVISSNKGRYKQVSLSAQREPAPGETREKRLQGMVTPVVIGDVGKAGVSYPAQCSFHRGSPWVRKHHCSSSVWGTREEITRLEDVEHSKSLRINPVSMMR